MPKGAPPVPKLVWALRREVRNHPGNALLLKNGANRLVIAMKSLGVEFAPPSRWEGMASYWEAARVLKKITGKDWYGEEAQTVRPEKWAGTNLSTITA